jgi:hypothetical protein
MRVQHMHDSVKALVSKPVHQARVSHAEITCTSAARATRSSR